MKIFQYTLNRTNCRLPIIQTMKIYIYEYIFRVPIYNIYYTPAIVALIPTRPIGHLVEFGLMSLIYSVIW